MESRLVGLLVIMAVAAGPATLGALPAPVNADVTMTQVYMSCGWPPTDGPYGSSEGSISYRQHPPRCYYSGDGSTADLINLVGIQWQNWGEPVAKATAKRVDNHDQDRNGFQRHPVRIVLSDLRPAVGHKGISKLYYMRLKVFFGKGESYVWSLYRPGQGAVRLPAPKSPKPKVHRVCGPLLPDGMGAYSYIETWGVRCAPAMRVAFRARKRFCRRHSNCLVDPSVSIYQIHKGRTRYRGWSCKVKVGWELVHVHCRKRTMRLIYRSGA